MAFTRDRRCSDVDDRSNALTIGLAVAQSCERIGSLARLRNEHRQAAFGHRCFAIAQLRRDVDFDRHAGQPLDPVLGDETSIKRRSAGRNCDTADFR